MSVVAVPPPVTASPAAATPPIRTALPPAGDESEWNPLKLDYRAPQPRPAIQGRVIDWHCHLFALRHADLWFEAADAYGIDHFLTMTPLEEAVRIQQKWGHRVSFIAIPQWSDTSPTWRDNWIRRIEAFYNLGSRVNKFHMAPGSIAARGWMLNEDIARPILQAVADRGMIMMSHIGDPTLWYEKKYTDIAKYGTRERHYAMWEELLDRYPTVPWVGAHLGGNPEDLHRLQRLLDRHPQVLLDLSATRWIVRELSKQRDDARAFIIRNEDRLLWGSDQVSGDDRGFDFLASRFWAHRKLWETAHIGPVPIRDPDVGSDPQPVLRGLALPTRTLQKIYRDNAVKLLASVGVQIA